MRITGVYKITNNITGDFYIGSSKNIKNRWTQHKSPSIWSHHPNSKLYKDMAQYGLNNFSIEIIEETDNLKEREQYWIEQLKPIYNKYRAIGLDYKEYYNTNKDKIQTRCKENMRKYRQTENGKENNRKSARKSMKRYNNQLCLYNSETLTLNALSARFYKAGIEHPTLEAKKYLLTEQ